MIHDLVKYKFGFRKYCVRSISLREGVCDDGIDFGMSKSTLEEQMDCVCCISLVTEYGSDLITDLHISRSVRWAGISTIANH